MLSGKYAGGARPAAARHTLFPGFQQRYLCEGSQAAAAEYALIAQKHGLSPATLALAWAFSRFYMARPPPAPLLPARLPRALYVCLLLPAALLPVKAALAAAPPPRSLFCAQE